MMGVRGFKLHLFFGVLVAVIIAVAFGNSSPQLIRDRIRETDNPFMQSLLDMLENPVETARFFVSQVTLFSLIVWPLIIYCSIRIMRVMFEPLHVERKAGDMGYIMDDGRSKMEIANEMMRRRRPGNLPPVYPNGWFSVGRSMDLKTGDIWYKSMLGKSSLSNLVHGIFGTKFRLV